MLLGEIAALVGITEMITQSFTALRVRVRRATKNEDQTRRPRTCEPYTGLTRTWRTNEIEPRTDKSEDLIQTWASRDPHRARREHTITRHPPLTCQVRGLILGHRKRSANTKVNDRPCATSDPIPPKGRQTFAPEHTLRPMASTIEATSRNLPRGTV